VSRTPNIVFILADDMGYGDFSAFNGGRSSTPNLDEMMERGVVLTQAYASSPICFPSRATLMTGKYPQRVGAVDLPHHRPFQYLSPDETTIGELFQQAGYRTGLVGKWHLGADELAPHRRGFDETACFCGGLMDYYRWTINRNGVREHCDGRYLTEVWTDEARSFIRRHRDEPFFLHLAYNAPHTPLQAPEEDVRPFRETGKFTDEVSTLYGMIRNMDAGVGRILADLDRLRLAEDTIVMFTSDNGPAMGKTKRYNHLFRGGKGNVYEGGIRVPMIIRWPGRLDGGREITDTVHFADWFPTLLNICGVDIPESIDHDGVDVMPLLTNGQAAPSPARCWQWSSYEPLPQYNAAIRDGDWKLIRPAPFTTRPLKDYRLVDLVRFMNADDVESSGVELPEGGEFENLADYFAWLKRESARPLADTTFAPDGRPTSPAELYNVGADPHEACDLAAEHPDIVRRLEAELDAWFERNRPEWERCRHDDPYGMQDGAASE
jgi:arylsulfatase A